MNWGEKRLPNLVFLFIAVTSAIGALTAALLLSDIHVGATHVSPTRVEGNPTCSDLQPQGQDWNQLKVDPPGGGDFSDNDTSPGPLEVTISSYSSTSFNWSSNMGVDAVFVKGGPEGNLYLYDPEVSADTGLTTTINPNNNDPYGISHILFCYDEEEPTPTPTPTPIPSPTSTATPSPTPEVLGEVQAPEALPATGQAPAGSAGSDLWLVLGIGGLALLSGGGALATVAVRRRR